MPCLDSNLGINFPKICMWDRTILELIIFLWVSSPYCLSCYIIHLQNMPLQIRLIPMFLTYASLVGWVALIYTDGGVSCFYLKQTRISEDCYLEFLIIEIVRIMICWSERIWKGSCLLFVYGSTTQFDTQCSDCNEIIILSWIVPSCLLEHNKLYSFTDLLTVIKSIRNGKWTKKLVW